MVWQKWISYNLCLQVNLQVQALHACSICGHSPSKDKPTEVEFHWCTWSTWTAFSSCVFIWLSTCLYLWNLGISNIGMQIINFVKIYLWDYKGFLTDILHLVSLYKSGQLQCSWKSNRDRRKPNKEHIVRFESWCQKSKSNRVFSSNHANKTGSDEVKRQRGRRVMKESAAFLCVLYCCCGSHENDFALQLPNRCQVIKLC